MGMMTSLISGCPRRETCTHGPTCVDAIGVAIIGVAAPIIRIFCRLAVHQTPIVARVSAALVGEEPSFVNWDFGTWIAIVWTLFVACVSTAGPAAVGIRWRF